MEHKAVIEQQYPQREHEVIQERVICGEDDADLPDRYDEEAYDSDAPRQKHRPHQDEFERQCEKRRRRMKPMREMLHIPADPGWQRAILVILVERREVSPLRIATQNLRHAR